MSVCGGSFIDDADLGVAGALHPQTVDDAADIAADAAESAGR
jgi:hypothetical protein